MAGFNLLGALSYTPVDGAGQPYAGALLYVYRAGTTTPTASYTTSALSVANPHPVVADGNGRFVNVWVDDSVAFDYRVRITTSTGSLIGDFDNIPPKNRLTQAQIAEILSPLTSAEQAVGVTSVNELYEVGNVLRYGAVGDDATDCLAAFDFARLLQAAGGPEIVIPEGTYRLSAPWTITHSDFRIRGTGNCVLKRASGTDDVVVIDGGATGTAYVVNGRMENLILEGSASIQHGLRLRGAHRNHFRNIRVRNVGTAALKTEFAILNKFDDLHCSINTDTMTTIPGYGALLFRRGAGENTVGNTFVNPIFEGIGVGFYFQDATSNTVVGGASEGNTTGGVLINTGSDRNTFIEHYSEANGTAATNYDYKIFGSYNRLINCTCNTAGTTKGLWITAGRRNVVEGGFFIVCNIDAGATRTKIDGALRTSTLTNAGVQTEICSVDGGGIDFDASRFGYFSKITPTLSGSWANYGSGDANAAYYRDPGNWVQLEGSVASGSAGTTIFTLPVGYRPTANLLFVCPGNNTTDVVRVEVQADGDVVHVDGSTTRVGLNNVRFQAQQ